MNRAVRRVLLAVAPQVVAAAPTVVVLTALAHRLPDRLASHFTAGGTADGFTGRGEMLVFTLAITAVMVAVFGIAAARFDGTRSTAISRTDMGRFLVGGAWGVAGLLGVTQYAAVAANLDRADPAAVTLPPAMMLIGLGVGVAAGLVGWALAGPTPVGDHEPVPVTAVPLGATEQVSWSRTVGAAWPLVLGGSAVAVGVVLLVTVSWLAALAPFVVGVLVVLLGRARVTVDRRGLTVALGVLAWPRIRIPADDVAEVSVADVSPVPFGGWGYRIVPGGSGVILRSGPALTVTRRSGRRFTVTVDDADTAAGVLGGVAAGRC